jgi:hypothetical protein
MSWGRGVFLSSDEKLDGAIPPIVGSLFSWKSLFTNRSTSDDCNHGRRQHSGPSICCALLEVSVEQWKIDLVVSSTHTTSHNTDVNVLSNLADAVGQNGYHS